MSQKKSLKNNNRSSLTSIRDKYEPWTEAKLKQLETEMEWVADEVEEAYRMDAEAIEEAWDTVERLLDTDKEVRIEINEK